ncbi:hypothetical protein KQX54_014305 [Cotesia glomerata]|uniref:Uncharacterized protein n=1 Tax=Cotesia glomerata TaxID=32391 RepID=A0AAV7IMF6_COTGL|nr:hypothetical protein KQX54_014305 [Cotesia glomerata]
MDYVMDFTGYYVPKKKYMIKEFCLIPISCRKPLEPKSDVVNPPYAWNKLPVSYQKQYEKRFNKKYGIDYSLGNCTVNDAFNVIVDILKQARVIYLKNYFRKKYLTQFTGIPFNNVVCLESQGYNSCQKVSPALCSYHASKKNCCVVTDALNMVEWLVQKSFAPKNSDCKPLLNLEVLKEIKDLADEVRSNASQRSSIISGGEFGTLNSKIERYRQIHAKLLEELEDLKNDSDYSSSSGDDESLFDKISNGQSFVSDAISLAGSLECNELIKNEERELDRIDDITAGLESSQKDYEDDRFEFDRRRFQQTDSMKIPFDDYEPSNYSFPDEDPLNWNLDVDADESYGSEDESFITDFESETENLNSEPVIMEPDDDRSDAAFLESEISNINSEPAIVESDEDESDITDLGLRNNDFNSGSVISVPESVDTLPFSEYDRNSVIESEDSDLSTEMSLKSLYNRKRRLLEDKTVIGSSDGSSSNFDRKSAFDNLKYRVQSDSSDSSCSYHKDDKTSMCAQKIALQMVEWLIKESVITNKTPAKRSHQLPGKASSSRIEVAGHQPADDQVDQKRLLNPLKRSRNSSTENWQLQENFENNPKDADLTIIDRDSDVEDKDQRQKRRRSLEKSTDLESEGSSLQEDQPRVEEPYDKVVNQILKWSNEYEYSLVPADENVTYEYIPESPKSDCLEIDESYSEDIDTDDEKIKSKNSGKIDGIDVIINDIELFDQFINDIDDILESEKDNELY